MNGVNEFKPHCQLRIRNISEQPRPVNADRFIIDKVLGTIDAQVLTNHRAYLAATGGGAIDDPVIADYPTLQEIHTSMGARRP